MKKKLSDYDFADLKDGMKVRSLITGRYGKIELNLFPEIEVPNDPEKQHFIRINWEGADWLYRFTVQPLIFMDTIGVVDEST